MAFTGDESNLMKDELEHLYDEVQILEEAALDERERLKTAVPSLLFWFREHARILPWRENPSPYRVWVSEIMLQQTRVEAVKPYFERFVRELPDVESLAEAGEDRLLKLWEGLGYYSRVRNLARGARQVMEIWNGEIPSSYDQLLRLPGIGSYTAGAIASIAFGRKVPAVDGNVLRVVSRVILSREDISDPSVKRRMEDLIREIMPEEMPGDFNQALMEVGATVCIPRGTPLCGQCPFYTLCLCRINGLAGEIPVKKAAGKRRVEDRTVFLISDGNHAAVRKRGERGLLAGLYEYPNVPGHLNPAEARSAVKAILGLSENGSEDDREESDGDLAGVLSEGVEAGDAVHIFSHVEWRMKGFLFRIRGPVPCLQQHDREDKKGSSAKDLVMADALELQKAYAIPNAFKAYTKMILEWMRDNGKTTDRNCNNAQ